MSNGNISGGKIAAVIGLVVFMFGAFAVMGGVSFFNESTRQINAYNGKLDANNADFDKMWKTIQQVAQVPDQHKDGFKEVMSSYASARSEGAAGDGDTFLSVMQEAVPDFSANAQLFAKIQTVVESQREGFSMRQKELRQMKVTHDDLIGTFPGLFYNSFVGHDQLVAVVVTSGKTKEAFATGEDNDVDLFN